MFLLIEIIEAMAIVAWRFLSRAARCMVIDPLAAERHKILVQYFGREHL